MMDDTTRKLLAKQEELELESIKLGREIERTRKALRLAGVNRNEVNKLLFDERRRKYRMVQTTMGRFKLLTTIDLGGGKAVRQFVLLGSRRLPKERKVQAITDVLEVDIKGFQPGEIIVVTVRQAIPIEESQFLAEQNFIRKEATHVRQH